MSRIALTSLLSCTGEAVRGLTLRLRSITHYGCADTTGNFVKLLSELAGNASHRQNVDDWYSV